MNLQLPRFVIFPWQVPKKFRQTSDERKQNVTKNSLKEKLRKCAAWATDVMKSYAWNQIAFAQAEIDSAESLDFQPVSIPKKMVNGAQKAEFAEPSW